jgi:hypothetical protein
MRRVAVLCAGVLLGGVLTSSTALASEDEGDRWIAVEDHVTVVLPNGETVTEEGEMGGEEQEFAPPVGTRVFISEALYETQDGTTRGDAAGRTHIECTAQVVPAVLACDAVFVLDDGSQLYGSALVDFSQETQQLALDVAVTGGTGDFDGATGEIALLDIGNEVAGDETVTRYETHLQ